MCAQRRQISLGIPVRMKKAWVLSYPLSAQQRHWSDWADAQVDLSLRWVHSHFVGFAMRGLIFRVCKDNSTEYVRKLIKQKLTIKPWLSVETGQTEVAVWLERSMSDQGLHYLLFLLHLPFLLHLLDTILHRNTIQIEPRQANLCLRAFRHDKF